MKKSNFCMNLNLFYTHFSNEYELQSHMQDLSLDWVWVIKL